MSESVNLLAAWLLTYALHSTLLLAAALLVMRKVRSAATRDLLCKVAAFAALITASAQTLIPGQADLQPLAGRWEFRSRPTHQQSVIPSRQHRARASRFSRSGHAFDQRCAENIVA